MGFGLVAAVSCVVAVVILVPAGPRHPAPQRTPPRAGAGRTVVVIDEPDAHLHPNLSRRLMRVLEQGVGPDGQLIIATHSPAILD